MTAVMILTLIPAMAFAEWEEGVEPVDAFFSGVLSAEIGDSYVDGLYRTKDGSSDICVRYTSDESENPVYFTYKENEVTDENGDTMLKTGFLREGADPDKDESYAYAYIDDDNLSIVEGANEIPILIRVPYTDPDTGELVYKDFNTTYRMWKSIDKPISVEFIPAPGFRLKGTVGYNFLNEEDFYGEGNMFSVSYEQPLDPEQYPDDPSPSMITTVDYKYIKTEDGVEGFYESANPEWERFGMTDGVECYLDKGLNKDVEFTYYAYPQGMAEPVELTFKVDIEADKYGLYADGYTSTYTGKVIKPRFRVYNTDDEVVSSKEYTYSTPKHKKIGMYNLTIRIKDQYKDKYDVDKVVVTYGIGPKAPVLSKLTSGSKSLTVNWKKMSAAQLKNIDGFYIELSTDKHFLNNYKSVHVSKKVFKAGKKVIKKLKKGKKYYVRMYSYKTVKQNGVKYKMPSNDSKILYRTTK